jgi:ATP-dependent Lon protease
LLATLDVRSRLAELNRILTKELEVLELGSKIQSQVQSEVGKNQREYFLREQMKAIQKELGEGDDQAKEIDELRAKIEAAGMPDDAKKEALRELDRLSKMPTAGRGIHRRAHVHRLAGVRAVVQADRRDINLARTKAVLDADHSGLERAKDRILEVPAVASSSRT